MRSSSTQHYSVSIKFESQTEAKDIKINNYNIFIGLHAAFYCPMFSSTYVISNLTHQK